MSVVWRSSLQFPSDASFCHGVWCQAQSTQGLRPGVLTGSRASEGWQLVDVAPVPSSNCCWWQCPGVRLKIEPACQPAGVLARYRLMHRACQTSSAYRSRYSPYRYGRPVRRNMSPRAIFGSWALVGDEVGNWIAEEVGASVPASVTIRCRCHRPPGPAFSSCRRRNLRPGFRSASLRSVDMRKTTRDRGGACWNANKPWRHVPFYTRLFLKRRREWRLGTGQDWKPQETASLVSGINPPDDWLFFIG